MARRRKKKSRTIAARKRSRRRVKPRKVRKRSKTLGARMTGAYRTVVDTIKGTDRLRNKLEPPATSETE